MRINQTTVQSIEPPASGYELHWDGELKGFGLRVTARGARSFFVERRIRGRNKRHTLGRWPATKPEQARKDAQAWLGAIASGRDPVAERERQKLAGITLQEAFKDYIGLKRRSKDGLALKPRTKADMLTVLEGALEDWQRKALVTIDRSMVERRYKQLADKSVARANIAMRYLRAVFNFTADRKVDSEGRSLIPDNPTKVLRKQWRAVRRRKRVLVPAQLPAWLTAVQTLGEVPDRQPGEGKLKPKLKHGEVFRDWFMFLALTGCRPSEALALLPDDVDLDARKFVFRDTKNRGDHELPMTDYLHALLKRRLEAGGTHVFASPHDGRPIGNSRHASKRVKELCKTHFSPGDLRRLAATAMEHAGVSRYTLKAVLNHMVNDSDDVTAGYVQVNEAMKLTALEKIERYVFSKPADVVNFPGARAA